MKYIIDTNVLFQKPEVLEEHDCVVTSHVLREIEHLERTRRSDRQLMFEIRRAKRYMRANKHYHMDLKDYKFSLSKEFDPDYPDNILLQVAVDNGYGLLTNDMLLEEKAELYNIPLMLIDEDHYVEHKGFKEDFLLKEELQEIYNDLTKNTYNLITNEYLIIYDELVTDKLEVLDILKWNGKSLVQLPNKKGKISLSFKSQQFGGFTPKDAYQMCAVDSVRSNDITQIKGGAGSGKSKIALETAYHLIEKGEYERLVIFVNPTPSRDAQELGFYTGDRLEKLLQSSVGTMLKSKYGDEVEIYRQIQDGNLDILPFVDIRGYETNGKKTILWILEAQNLTKDLMKLGLQRAGDDCKVIIDGDYHQQVDKDAYASSNGMKRASEIFRGDECYGEIELQEIYRSRIAKLADKM